MQVKRVKYEEYIILILLMHAYTSFTAVWK